MKKALSIIILLVILGIAVWAFNGKNDTVSSTETPGPSTSSAPVSETVKVNDKLSEYKNEELGFSVQYPSVWEAGVAPTGVSFVIPASKTGNTVRKLESKIQVVGGKCAFPPITTIKERNTLKSGDLTFNMIQMSNSVQGVNYFDRMYSLQRESVCYVFSFSSVVENPTNKGYKGSEATQMSNNNKAIIDSADAAFTTMVKSFKYVVGAAGQDETQVNPAKR